MPFAALDVDEIPLGAFGYCRTREDVQSLPYAGQSSYKQTLANMGPLKPVKPRSETADLSLLQPGHGKQPSNLRLDPACFSTAAGGAPTVDALPLGKAIVQPDVTDPITHFEHLGLKVSTSRPAKRTGFAHNAGAQTWTWAQDPAVKESWGLDPYPKQSVQRFANGADGTRYFNMFGCEDLMPAATRPYMKSDRPAKADHIAYNDKEFLPYFLREGLTKQRPVHNYWSSDDMWAVMRDDIYLKSLNDQVGEAFSHSRQPTLVRSSSCSSADACSDENGIISGGMRHKENCPPRHDQNRCHVEAYDDTTVSGKAKPSKRIDSALTPRGMAATDARPCLSMTPRSISRCDATPRSMTPRSSAASNADLTCPVPKLKLTPSVPSLGMRQEASCQVTPRLSLRSQSVCGEITPRSCTPRSALQSHHVVRGAKSQGSATPRSATPRSMPSLSMAPQLISRRVATPRSATPRGSTPRASASVASSRGLRKSASEVVLVRN